MGKKLVLCVILCGVLLALYYLLRHCGGSKHRQRKLGMGPVNPNVAAVHNDPCDYLASNGYDPSVVSACDKYGKICGMASSMEHTLAFSENFDPFDKNDSINAMQSDLADVMVHPNNCQPPAQCSSNTDCQPMGTDFGLSCKNIVCKPDDCQPGEECTQHMVCTGACL
jgi:hypothetical protein